MTDCQERESLPSRVETYEENDDTSIVPLLSPTSPATHPETSTARSAEQQKGLEQIESHNLKQLRRTALYIENMGDLVLRASAVVLTLIASVLTTISRDDSLKKQLDDVAYSKLFLSGYLLSVNVVVFLYSLCILGFSIFQLINWKTRVPSSLLYLLPIFQLDQTFAYLLISASSNSFRAIGNLTCRHHLSKSSICERALASAIVSVLSSSSLAAASLFSGCRMASKIRSYSHTSPLALCNLLEDGSKDCNLKLHT